MRRVFCPCCPLAAVLLMAGLAAAPRAAAQSPAAAFEGLKKTHMAEVTGTVEPLRENYCRALLTLERSLAAKGDYSGARAVRKERLSIEELMKTGGAPGAPVSSLPAGGTENSAPASSPAARDNEGRVILSPEIAHATGGVKLDDSKKYLTGWSAAGAAARWLLPPGLPEGGYDVEVSFSLFPATAATPSPSSGGDAGSFEIRENFHTLTRRLIPPEAAIGAGPDGTVTMVLGTLRLCSNAVQLEIKAVTPKPDTLLQLRSLRLIPVSGASS